MEVEKNLATIEKLINSLIEFAVTYGFQIVGALVFLFIGLKLALWLGHKVAGMAEAKNLDVTLSKFVAGQHAIFRTAQSIPENLCSRHSPRSIGRAMFFAERVRFHRRQVRRSVLSIHALQRAFADAALHELHPGHRGLQSLAAVEVEAVTELNRLELILLIHTQDGDHRPSHSFRNRINKG